MEQQREQSPLKKVRAFYEAAVQHSVYQNWRTQAQTAWQFYDGEQWTAEEQDKLQQNGQPPIVINKIAPKVDNIAGSEVAGRTRIIYRSRSGDAQEEETARNLSDLALFVAERNDQAVELSQVFRAGMVTGLGWLDVGVQQADEGVQVFNRAENELDVVFDPHSRLADLSDARFVARERWLDEEQLKMLFPKTAEQATKQLAQGGLQGSRFGQPVEQVQYVDAEHALLKMVEVQYKQTEKRYRVKPLNGQELLTFDKKLAYADTQAEVSSEFAPRVYVAYFAGDALLSHQPLPYDHQRFTLASNSRGATKQARTARFSLEDIFNK